MLKIEEGHFYVTNNGYIYRVESVESNGNIVAVNTENDSPRNFSRQEWNDSYVSETSPLTLSTRAIRKTRESNKSHFDDVEGELKKMKETLDNVISLKGNATWKSIVNADAPKKCNDDWIIILDEANKLAQRIKEFTSKDGDFTLAKTRSNRKYVNIGAIGITREGKSEFTIKATKLDKWIIPVKQSSHACTAAPIDIINGVSNDGKTEIARVYYYTVIELVKQIGDYLEAFNKSRIIIEREGIFTIEQLKKWCHKQGKEILPTLTGKPVLLEKFTEYINHVDKYAEKLLEVNEDGDLLPTSRGRQFFKDFNIQDIKEKNDIAREYYSSVSYYKTADPKGGVHEAFVCYATKRAEVYTQFQIEGKPVENLRFLDTPGIGEEKIGIDEILSNAVAMDLDIILAIRAVRDSNKENQEQNFIQILRDKLDGKNLAKNWVYYLLNVWDNQTYNDAVDAKENIKQYLSNGSTNKIQLSDDHFVAINLKDGVGYNEDGSPQTDAPIEKFLSKVLNALIPQISAIDKEFYKDANDEFTTIKEAYQGLINKMKVLPLPTYSSYDMIEALIGKLQEALSKIGSAPDIYGGVSHSIDAFCKEETGIVVSELFGIESPVGIKFDDIVECTKFHRAHIKKIESKLTQAYWDSSTDFQTYINLKEKLLKLIEEKIKSKINQKEAIIRLDEAKSALAKIFKEVGKLTFIKADNDSKWLEHFLKAVEAEGRYKALAGVLRPLTEVKVDIANAIKDNLSKVKSLSRHSDNFGNPEEYDFQEYENACVSFIHSLCSIEMNAKGYITDEMIKGKLKNLQHTFRENRNLLVTLSVPKNPNSNSDIRMALHHFYEAHAAEVFVGDTTKEKNALVAAWNARVQNNTLE